ncbi:hypothetical protein EAH87_06340 [Sphingomonas koreensis]|nr:hypothetical protein EAH87_06340 [Sphingomonas koreensis]
MTAFKTTSVSLLALAGALALAGCNSSAPNANDAAINAATIDNAAAAVPADDLALPAGDTAVVEDESTAPPIQIVEVPAPAATTPAADAAPLTDALAAEQLIDAGSDITRVQQTDGWAWMQDGQIIRTASSDGHRVSYFKRGSTAPYFVQQDGASYGYSNGKLAHQYDDRGRVQTPDATHQRQAQQVADQARQQHDRAQQASKTAPHIDRSHDRPGGQQATDHTPPRPQPTQGNDHNNGNDGHIGSAGNDHSGSTGNDRGSTDHGSTRPTPHPTPTPTPTPTAHDAGHQPPSSGHDDRSTHNRDYSSSNQTSPRH